MDPITIASAGVSALGGLFGGIFGGKKQREAEDAARKALREKQRRLDDYYNHQSGIDVVDTSSAQSTLNILRRQNNKTLESINNDAVKRGATSEAKVAAASRLNENYADAVSRIAAMGEQRRQQLDQMKFANDNQIASDVANLDFNSAINKANAISGWGDQVSNLGSMAMSLYGQGVFGKKKQPGGKFDSDESIIGVY